MDRAVTDLPEPDSPTSASVRPLASEKETSSTALVAAAALPKAIERFWISRRGVSGTEFIQDHRHSLNIRPDERYSRGQVGHVFVSRHYV